MIWRIGYVLDSKLGESPTYYLVINKICYRKNSCLHSRHIYPEG